MAEQASKPDQVALRDVRHPDLENLLDRLLSVPPVLATATTLLVHDRRLSRPGNRQWAAKPAGRNPGASPSAAAG